MWETATSFEMSTLLSKKKGETYSKQKKLLNKEERVVYEINFGNYFYFKNGNPL